MQCIILQEDPVLSSYPHEACDVSSDVFQQHAVWCCLCCPVLTDVAIRTAHQLTDTLQGSASIHRIWTTKHEATFSEPVLTMQKWSIPSWAQFKIWQERSTTYSTAHIQKQIGRYVTRNGRVLSMPWRVLGQVLAAICCYTAYVSAKLSCFLVGLITYTWQGCITSVTTISILSVTTVGLFLYLFPLEFCVVIILFYCDSCICPFVDIYNVDSSSRPNSVTI